MPENRGVCLYADRQASVVTVTAGNAGEMELSCQRQRPGGALLLKAICVRSIA